MMDERQIVEETIAYLGAEQRRLEKELAKKKREYEKLEVSFSELSFFPFLKEIFQRKFKSLMSTKAHSLQKEIPVLRERVNQFTQAIADLEQGIYNTAIPLLNQITEPTDSILRPKSTILYILDLEKQLISFHEAQA